MVRSLYMVVSVGIVMIMAGCGGKTIRPDSSTEVVVPGVVSVAVNRLKVKKERFDFELVVTNKRSDGGILIYLGSLGCGRGNTTGLLKHVFLASGEDTIHLRPGQSMTYDLVCKLSVPAKGEFKFLLGKVLDNPELDGKTAGKILADDVIWTHADVSE
jgi:hypothetical protein